MAERVVIEPHIAVKDGEKDQLVAVGPLDWAGVKKLVEAFGKADLPLPNLDASAVADIATFIGMNLPVLAEWVFKHPPIVSALVVGATGLTDAQIDTLSAGKLMKVARASWKALVDDGFFEEVGGFFGDLLPLGQVSAEQGQPESESQSPPASGETSPAESKSESEPSPAGV